MKNFIICIFLFFHFPSCSNMNSISAKLNDPLDKILILMKERKPEHLEAVLGSKFSIDKEQSTKELEVREYNNTIGLALVKVYIQKKQNRIDGIGAFYFLDFDNYQHLKNKFGHLTWTEKKLENKSDHVVEDNRSVYIKEIGLRFEYDEYSPKRKILWLFFE